MGKFLMIVLDDGNENIFDQILSFLNQDMNQLEKRIILKQALKFKGIDIDLEKRLVIREEKEIELTFCEFEILILLARNPGRIFGKEYIYDYIWKEPYSGDYNVVMQHIRNIRKKIEDNPSNPIYIQTIRGVGYRFNLKI